MTLGVHQVDGRIAARNAVKIRAALRAGIDAKKIFADYQDSHPTNTGNTAQDRARARAWSMIHINLDMTAFKQVLRRVYAEMYVTGQASTEEILRNLGSTKKAPEPSVVIDWNNWKPGNQAAEALIRPPGGLQKLLNGIEIKSAQAADTSYNLLGTALADAFNIGASPTKAAKMIQDALASPQRSLTIALTEGSRAANSAAIDSYRATGIERIEWLSADPINCACVDLNGEIVNLGDVFPSSDEGVTEPPEHPNCRCTTLPVSADFSD